MHFAHLSIVVSLLFMLVPMSAQAANPGLNGKLAFVSSRDGDTDVYTMNANGTGVVNLTANTAADVQPSWSPDGTRIAFVSDRGLPPCDIYPCDRDIYVMNADGTG